MRSASALFTLALAYGKKTQKNRSTCLCILNVKMAAQGVLARPCTGTHRAHTLPAALLEASCQRCASGCPVSRLLCSEVHGSSLKSQACILLRCRSLLALHAQTIMTCIQSAGQRLVCCLPLTMCTVEIKGGLPMQSSQSFAVPLFIVALCCRPVRATSVQEDLAFDSLRIKPVQPLCVSVQ